MWISSVAPVPKAWTPSSWRSSAETSSFSSPCLSPTIWPRASSRQREMPISYGTPLGVSSSSRLADEARSPGSCRCRSAGARAGDCDLLAERVAARRGGPAPSTSPRGSGSRSRRRPRRCAATAVRKSSSTAIRPRSSALEAGLARGRARRSRPRGRRRRRRRRTGSACRSRARVTEPPPCSSTLDHRLAEAERDAEVAQVVLQRLDHLVVAEVEQLRRASRRPSPSCRARRTSRRTRCRSRRRRRPPASRGSSSRPRMPSESSTVRSSNATSAGRAGRCRPRSRSTRR